MRERTYLAGSILLLEERLLEAILLVLDLMQVLQGVEVVITDSEGASISLTTNAAGNFYASPSQYSPVMPITAVVRTADGERAMATPQASGNCASCHTADGTGGAPGRVMAP